ncbi:MAG TPA: ATP-binding protein, partial [Candidatus Altiarchaeales archaeon]|nr:ATP-binding protein [Candidatus Altiarchaeales archaeon]
MYKIKDIVRARKEVLEGPFQGVIQTHKVDAKEKRLENNPREFLKITYPSSAIKRTLERIKEKLSGKSNQGGFLLVGPYGSGKSHTLITIYHLFNNPSLARDWGRRWKIDIELPEKSRSVIISTRRYDVDHLWEPIFKLLGKYDMLSKIKRFPTTDQIEEIIGDDTIAIFIDEIENWYGAFDPEKQAHLIEQNETFLEHLLEVAADPTKKLFVFITFLEEKEGLKKIFNRTKPMRIDVSPIEEREKVTLHRLFEDIESVDESKVETVVEEYINAYSEPIKIDDTQNYKRRMKRTYPFHPLLLDTLFQIYEAAAERQDIRGMLNVLADAVRDTYERKDLILVSDVDENAFRGIDLKLIEKYEFDLERVKDIGFA